jgi:hypothetical protein
MRDETPEAIEKALFRSALGDFCIMEEVSRQHDGADCNYASHRDDIVDDNEHVDMGVVVTLHPQGEKNHKTTCEGEVQVKLEDRCGINELAEALQRRDPLELG